MIWLEGINDFSRNGNAALDTVTAGMRDIAARLRARIAGVRVVGATLTSALNATNTLFETLQKTSRQAMQVAESNLDAVTTVASKTARRAAEQASSTTGTQR